MQFEGDIYVENLEVGNIVTAPHFMTAYSRMSDDTIMTRNLLLSDKNQEGDNVLIYNYYDADKDIGYVNVENLYADYEIRTDGCIYEEGEALVDRYAPKDSIGTTKIKYSDLVAMRGSKQLIPGHFYQITDYTCTTTQENTSAAKHRFNIIVRADASDLLNETA